MKKSLGLALTLCFFAPLVHAKAITSDVNLPILNGEVVPHQVLTVPLASQVQPMAVYGVSCKIQHPKAPEQLVMRVEISGLNSFMLPMIQVNGQSTGNQAALIKNDNTLVVSNIGIDDKSAAALVFRNLDNDNSFTVQSCKAYPMV